MGIFIQFHFSLLKIHKSVIILSLLHSLLRCKPKHSSSTSRSEIPKNPWNSKRYCMLHMRQSSKIYIRYDKFLHFFKIPCCRHVFLTVGCEVLSCSAYFHHSKHVIDWNGIKFTMLICTSFAFISLNYGLVLMAFWYDFFFFV